MKLSIALIIATLTFAILPLAKAQSTSSSTIDAGPTVLFQRKDSIAVIDVPVKQLWAKDKWTASIDSLFGANTSANEPAIGGAIAAHYHKTSAFALVGGLGTTFDTTGKFRLTDLRFDKVGFLIGCQWSW